MKSDRSSRPGTALAGSPGHRAAGLAAGVILLALLAALSGPLSFAEEEAGSPLVQLTAGGHVLGFGESQVCFASSDHALTVEFADGRAVAPVVEASAVAEASGGRTTSPRAEDLASAVPRGGTASPIPLERVSYPEVWDGVTVVYEACGGAVAKSTYLVAAGAGASGVENIRLRYNRPVRLDGQGRLVTSFETGEIVEGVPKAWQETGGVRRPVDAAYRLLGEREVGFRVAGCEPGLPLVIDPELTWSSFLGSVSGSEQGFGIAVDASQNVYVVGYGTATWGSPVRPYSASIDAFVVKLNSDGTIAWNTFLGTAGYDYGQGIAVGDDGYLYIGGQSEQSWGDPVRAHSGGNDGFVAKLATANGAISWNTFLGSSSNDACFGVAVDGSGNSYTAGYSLATWGAPVRPHAGNYDAFAAELATNGALVWNTFLGGTGADQSYGGVAVDGSGNVYVAGRSGSSWGSPVRAYTANSDGIAVKLAGNGSLTWHTFLGGGGNDTCIGIAADEGGSVYLTGDSSATWGSPVLPYTAGADAMAVRLASDGSLTWNTFLGGSDSDYAKGIRLDGSGNIVIAGFSLATWGSPITPYEGDSEGFAAKLASNGALGWNTFLGSSASDTALGVTVDTSANIYVAGQSAAGWGLPAEPYMGGTDGYAAKLPETPTLVVLVSFAALPRGDHIVVAWETASEIDNAGFHLWRCETEDGEYKRITKELIPAEGGASWGATYAFKDHRVTRRQRYFYKLEDVDYGGSRSFTGPVSAILLGSPSHGVPPAGDTATSGD